MGVSAGNRGPLKLLREGGFSLLEVVLAAALVASATAAGVVLVQALSAATRSHATPDLAASDGLSRLAPELSSAKPMALEPDRFRLAIIRSVRSTYSVEYSRHPSGLTRQDPAGHETILEGGGHFSYYTEDGAPAGSSETAARIVVHGPHGPLFAVLAPYRVHVHAASVTRRFPEQ